LFGYFRYPDIQTTSDRGCPDPATTPFPPQVALFRDRLAKLRTANQPLVAMGENFAPELLAREARNQTPGSPYFGELIDKDLFTASSDAVGSDNVACFLRLMNFDAVVPGQQDFYYGPERLRQLARFLAQPGAGSYHPVQMLAANLIVSSTVRKQNPRLPVSALPAEIRSALTSNAPFRLEIPAFVLPWLSGVTIDRAPEDLTVYDCAAAPENPQDFALPPDRRCKPLARNGSEIVLRKGALEPGSNHAFCGVWNKEQNLRCQLFSVQSPLLQYRPSSRGETPVPYLVPANPNEPAIFGVLDPELVGYIGQLNDVWINVDKRFDTRADIGDPVEALRQVLGACNADPDCRGRHKILLAQMPYYRASQLAAHLKAFDIVISEPDEEHASGEEARSRRDESGSLFLLTPGIAFDAHRAEPLTINLRRADYFEAGDRRYLANQVEDAAVQPQRDKDCKACALKQAMSAHTPGAGAAHPADYEKLGLRAMQQFCGADIALLQHRDIFSGFDKAVAYWPANAPADTQNLLNEVLWKGDFAFCVPLRGSTIKRVLQESAAFDKQDQDNLSLAVEKGRGLSTLGIETDPNTNSPAIHGQPIDDNKLYGVAMTDYLAFGNTGYPELSSEAIPPVVRVVSLRDLNRLSGLACEQLPAPVTRGSCQADPIPADEYFAAISQQPFDTTRGITAWLAFRRWFQQPIEPQPIATTILPFPKGNPEIEAEHRPYWWFTLQNVSLGYNLNFIGGSPKTVPGDFAGNNSFSQLSTPESSGINLWARARGGYSFTRYVDFYMSGEVKISRLAVRTTTGDGNFGEYQITLGNNLLRSEAGISSKPLTPRLPIRLFVSEDLFTQAITPFQQFNAPVACGTLPCPGGATALTNYDLPKNYLLVTRLGARIQNTQSWFEAGREYGSNINLVNSYSLDDLATPVPLECNITSGISLSNCIGDDPLFTNRSQIVPHTQTQAVAGWFANFHVVVPVWRSNLQLIADSYGEVFDRMPGDTRYNTRFYEDLTVGLKVPLWGNLSFAPQIETFYYQNKILPEPYPAAHHYVFVTTSVALQYAFDWHRGVGLLRALRYPSGVSTAATETTPRP
jgi:hypothetical protein